MYLYYPNLHARTHTHAHTHIHNLQHWQGENSLFNLLPRNKQVFAGTKSIDVQWSGQHQAGEANSKDQESQVRDVAEEELPQAAGQGLPKDNITHSTASSKQLQWRQAEQNSKRDIWPRGTESTGLSWGLSLRFNQALQRPFVFFSQPSLSAPFPYVTSALGTHPLRATKPVMRQRKNVGLGIS